MTRELRKAREDLAAAFRWAARLGLNEGICNHFSAVAPGRDDAFLINAQGLHWSEITARNLVLVDGDGRVTEDGGEVEPTARFIHWRVHKASPRARCVLHTHMPYATALASLERKELRFINQNAVRFYGRVAYDHEYNGIALDEGEGDRIAATLGDKAVLMMGNHGVLVTGATVAAAWSDLYYLERACQTLVLAMGTGQPLDDLPSQILESASRSVGAGPDYAELHFAALKRVLDRDEPDYKH